MLLLRAFGLFTHRPYQVQVDAKCEREAAVLAKKAARDAEREAAKALSQEERRFQREVKRCAKLGLPPPSPMPKCASQTSVCCCMQRKSVSFNVF